MVVDLEKLKKARLAVGTVWTTMDTDSQLAEDVLWANEFLLQIMDQLEVYDKAKIIKKGGIHDEVGKT